MGGFDVVVSAFRLTATLAFGRHLGQELGVDLPQPGGLGHGLRRRGLSRPEPPSGAALVFLLLLLGGHRPRFVGEGGQLRLPPLWTHEPQPAGPP